MLKITRNFSTSCSRNLVSPGSKNTETRKNQIEEPSKLRGRKTYDPGFKGVEEVKVNFRGLRLYNKRHARVHKNMLFQPFEKRDPQYADIYEHKYGTRGTGIRHEADWEHVPEKVPELIVPPDLKDCKLKPYVSYRTQSIELDEYTAEDLFDAVYKRKIVEDYENGKIDAETGDYKEPPEDDLSAEEAWIKARQTGSDIFQGGVEPSKEWSVKWERQ